MQAIRVSIYLAAFIAANFIVLYFGKTGLIITAALLIPFDFVMRCVFHETWKGAELIIKLGSLVAVAGLITFLINSATLPIALGSVSGFVSAQIIAGIFYQIMIERSYFIKVNGSDLFGIMADSIIFQYVAFGEVDLFISVSQIALKFAGGLFWYWVLFVKLKIQKKWELDS